MVYNDQAAIDFLTASIKHDDPAASSHWRKFHKNFVVHEDGSFTGVQGFGGCSPPYRGFRSLAHTVLQRKFRRMAESFPEFDRLDRIAPSITERQSRAYDLDALRQTITLAFLKKLLPSLTYQSVVAVIGDGFASMTALLLASRLAKQVFLVNLNKTLLVDIVYFQKWAGTNSGLILSLVVDAGGLVQSMNSRGVIAIQAINHALLRQAPLDLVINIASMQEMDPPAIFAYFEDMRAVSRKKTLAFYCCNREEKQLPDGTITRFTDYAWRTSDQILVDELCPWHQQYYSLYPPFYRLYDGPIRHRLVQMT